MLLQMKLIFVIVTAKFTYSEFNKCNTFGMESLCSDQDICFECLQISECCVWCYDENYTGSRCGVKYSNCSQDKIEQNQQAKVELSKMGTEGNLNFSEITKGTDFENIIQIQPQLANIILRKDIPVNFSFSYKPAENYPLELYYLSDLSGSMVEVIDYMKNLGGYLSEHLTQLTENYRVAYGSFMDKPGLPFYTDFICDIGSSNCEAGYLFKHWLNFTSNMELFFNIINMSKITKNLDDLDGALEGIWQILSCPEHIKWSKSSRKIILLPTDSLLHMAGDGKLVGAVLKPKQVCLLDENGLHKAPLKYDFPSIEELIHLLRREKVNLIFLINDAKKYNYYQKLQEQLFRDYAYVGELANNSSNILPLIKSGFYNFTNVVSFSVNSSLAKHINIEFYADCENRGIFNKTNVCYDVHTKQIKFKIKITLTEIPSNDNDILYIEENSIHEKVLLNITYITKCRCKNQSSPKTNCLRGHEECGACICSDGWTGKFCNETCYGNFNCRKMVDETLSEVCSLNGECNCGKCECDFPFNGKYCEYKCPISKNGLICGGPSNGVCSKGKCICTDDFQGKYCSCSKSTKNCKLLDRICSNIGECKCGSCKCPKNTTGKWCEVRNGNNISCEKFSDCVEDAVLNTTGKCSINDISITMVEQENIDICDIPCRTIMLHGTNRCIVDFCYESREDSRIHITVLKSCIISAQFAILTTAVAVGVAILVGGICFILLYKYRLYRAEQEEYRLFDFAAKNATQLNPIFKDPKRSYLNPMYKEN